MRRQLCFGARGVATIASSDVRPQRATAVSASTRSSTGRDVEVAASGSTTSSGSVATSDTIALRRLGSFVSGISMAASARRARPSASARRPDPMPVTSRYRPVPAQVASTSTKAGTSSVCAS